MKPIIRIVSLLAVAGCLVGSFTYGRKSGYREGVRDAWVATHQDLVMEFLRIAQSIKRAETKQAYDYAAESIDAAFRCMNVDENFTFPRAKGTVRQNLIAYITEIERSEGFGMNMWQNIQKDIFIHCEHPEHQDPRK
jgi:hypothetical protein